MPASLARSARIAAGIFFLWSVTTGGSHLFAAEDPLSNPISDPLNELVPQSITEAESTPDQPPESEDLGLSDNLGLLDPGDGTYVDCGDCGECSDCAAYGGCGEGGYCEEAFHDPGGLLWFRADYLLWWTRGARLPPLVTTSPVGAPVGVLGYDTTTVLFGDSMVHVGGRSSYRLKLGYWLDYCKTLGLEGHYFDLGHPKARYSKSSSGDLVLARPFFDAFNGIESSQTIAYPGTAVGDVDAEASDYFASVGMRLRCNLLCFEPCCNGTCYEHGGCPSCTGGYCGDMCDYGACHGRNFRLDLIAGYRHYRLINDVGIREHVVSTGPPTVVGTVFDVFDAFRTTNHFNGGELGLVAEYNNGPWSVEFLAAMTLGNNHKVVRINGATAVTTPGFDPIPYAGGLLALPTNMGAYDADNFVIIPEFGVELGYQVTPRLRAFLGYNFLYWARVVRAGDQIDLNVNPTQVPPGALVGAPRPRFEFRNADFWAQGMNVGLELRF